MAYIISVGRGIPEYDVEQKEVKYFMQNHILKEKPNMKHYLSVFDHANIDHRQLVMPLQWYKRQHDFHSANKVYKEKAIDLSLEAIDDCLDMVKKQYILLEQFSYEHIDAIIFVSSTGIATPSIDAYIMNERSFKSDLVRMPLWGLGCAGGAVGIARASDYLKANPNKSVMVICCELCSLTFQVKDMSPRNVVGTALFGDGVSATLLFGENFEFNHYLEENVLSVKRSHSFLAKETLDIMGWKLKENGLHVVFSTQIPKLIKSVWKKHVLQFLKETNVTMNEINMFIAHPGGRKVLEEIEEVGQIEKEKLIYSYETLQAHGNMSSATVMYVLKKWLDRKDFKFKQKTYGLLSALGPGFSSELVLLEWVHR